MHRCRMFGRLIGQRRPADACHLAFRPNALTKIIRQALKVPQLFIGEARQVYEDIHTAIHDLSDMPTMGKRFVDPAFDGRDYRTWPVGNYRIFYTYDVEALTVWRVVHTSQDIDEYGTVEL